MTETYVQLVQHLAPILHEDAAVAAVSKPAGIDVGRLAGFDSAGLTELLPRIYPGADFGEPVNRLSRFESGVLVFVRDEALRERLRALWNAGKVKQEVEVVARGRMKRPSLVLTPADAAEKEAQSKPPAGQRGPRAGRPAAKVKARRPKAAPAMSPDATKVQQVHEGSHRVVVRCRTTAKSTHALKAVLRSAGLHVLGDTRGGSRGLRDRPERTCLHVRRVAITHPVTGKPVTFTAPPSEGFTQAADECEPLDRVLSKALARRMECLLDDTTDAFRLLSGDAEGVPGVNVDKYGDVLVMHLLDGRNVPHRAERLTLARSLMRTFRATAVYQKIDPKDRSSLSPHEAEMLVTDRPLAGREVEPVVVVSERGLKFETHPLDPLAAGLYLDHRENRARVRAMAQGRHVLNLFAYTCGFSVAAAAGGAESVVSVDQSKRALEWGKVNFDLNALPVASHAFYPDEVFDFLRRADRRERRFDLIILDPPTFARMKKPKRTFHVAEDLPDLVRATLPLLAPRGIMLVATNFRTLPASKFTDLIRKNRSGRKLRVLETPPLPADFAADPHHHKAVFLQAED
ncbi:MAG: class I SAM-dependent methyltransferase [Phycisphaerales bacterium]|nr:class I SAM-dependent methyltransferase [Phycisphaerales bacterium]